MQPLDFMGAAQCCKTYPLCNRQQKIGGDLVMSLSLFKAGVSRLSKSMSAGYLGNEAETQKVMSQKCIENIYFRTIFLRHKKR
jgi:hypothetical protein